MTIAQPSSVDKVGTLEIIAFWLQYQEFCVRTTTIREIRGWGPATPLPHSPPNVVGVMNLHGSVIPIGDLARKLGMKSTEPNKRSAIVVAEVHGMVTGLVVDRVSDILTIAADMLQPVPDIGVSHGTRYADGIITRPEGMVCFLNPERMFEQSENLAAWAGWSRRPKTNARLKSMSVIIRFPTAIKIGSETAPQSDESQTSEGQMCLAALCLLEENLNTLRNALLYVHQYQNQFQSSFSNYDGIPC